MASFVLGNHTIDDILTIVSQNISTKGINWVADEITNGTIEVSAESTDITDRKGNVVRTKYRSKSGTFTCTSAFLHPAIMNAQSGSDLMVASETSPIADVPEMVTVDAGQTVDVSTAKEGTIKVIGLFGNGANDKALTDAEVLALISGGTLTTPAAGEDKPTRYFVTFDRDITSGIAMTNSAETFPKAQILTMACAYTDPCGEARPCFVRIPRFVPDPSVSISFDAENQEIELAGAMNIEYCSSAKQLYTIYYPDEELVVSGDSDDGIS